MTEESAPIDDTPPPASEEPSSAAQRDGSGPGFRLGLLAGAFAGAVAARLLTPKEGERLPAWLSNQSGPSDRPAGRIAAILALVRARMQNASHEAQEAAQDAEERLRGRYADLTR